MKIDAHPSCGTGDTGVERPGKCNHEWDTRKGSHKLLPISIICSNPADDIEGEREEEGRCS